MIGRFRVGLNHICEPYRRVIAALLDALLETWGERLVSLVVYGSVARCEARPDSDIDLLIVGERLPKSRFKRLELFEEAEEKVASLVEEYWERGYTFDFSPVILDASEAVKTRPLYLDMVEDAIIVYDKDGFMQSVLERVRRRLAELGAERVRVGKRWYWVLKKDYKPGEVIEI